jgi:aromatic ring-opening dioxygenase catalytic subunit (LigB family)
VQAFLRSIATTLSARPRAVLVVSANWQQPDFAPTAGARLALPFDCYGFPPCICQLRHPVPGQPALAARALSLMSQAGLGGHVGTTRGFDHRLVQTCEAEAQERENTLTH